MTFPASKQAIFASLRWRRRWLLLALLCCCLGNAHAARSLCQAPPWPQWEAFKTSFISQDGRVIDRSTPQQQTVSEGQAYALFFALVANDRPAFARILKWTEDNLAGGDLTARLPAWHWGKKDNGSWGVLDANPASDADLWLVYALGEAGRLWQERRYVALSSLLANRTLAEETANLPGLGLTLLPAPHGFHLGQSVWRLNPSYLPMQLFDWLGSRSSDARWRALAASSLRVLLESAPRGYAPDWILYEAGKGFRIDHDGEGNGKGGYNAIRVYLWVGMLPPESAARTRLLTAFAPMSDFVARHGYPPEQIDIHTGRANGPGPSGFSAALLPFLSVQNNTAALNTQIDRIITRPPRADAYYEQALMLFALGWRDGHYRFAKDGSLQPSWKITCNHA
ncbi:MAG: endoglucanase [Burkholderiaceae bacterium]|nr:endoglucanase [Burkholderiaceae bacterium]